MSAIALDPLIAEAKARARRRRLIALGMITLTAAIAIGVTLATGSVRDVKGPPPVGRFESSGGSPQASVAEVSSDSGVTWAADYRHLWLTTTGGRTWRTALPPHLVNVSATRIGDVQFVDRRHGWLSSDTADTGVHTSHRWEIDRTTDGGRRWQTSILPGCASCDWGNLSFFDVRHGYVFVWASEPTASSHWNAGTKLFSTSDGGATWKLVSEPRLTPPAEARFVDPQHGIAVTTQTGTSGFRVFRTSDGGRIWQPVLLEGKRVYPGWFGAPYITAVRGTLVIVAERFLSSRGQSVVYTSGDGGVHWQTHVAPAKVFFGYGLFSAASPDTWVASDDHTRHFFETTDGGASWRQFTAPHALLNVRWIHFASARVGWAVLENNQLVRTTDGGLLWKLAGPPGPKQHRHR